MKTHPDFSAYLTADRIAEEESAWAKVRYFERNAGNILHAASLFSLGESFSLIELGCGSGWVPTILPPSIDYLGVDANPLLLELARAKNSPSRRFLLRDIREFSPTLSPANLVASFAVLKHFSLDEFPFVFRRMLRAGDHGVFNVQISSSPSAYDDGTEFHHTWISMGMIHDSLREESRVLQSSDLLHSDAKGEDRILYTRPA